MKRLVSGGVSLFLFGAGVLVGVLLASAIARAAASGSFNGYPTMRIIVNGQELHPDVPAIVMNDRTLVPVRFVAEALGATVSVSEKGDSVLITSASVEPAASTTPAKPSAAEIVAALDSRDMAPLDQARSRQLALISTDTTGGLLGYLAYNAWSDEKLAYEKSVFDRTTKTMQRTSTKPKSPYNPNSVYGDDTSDVSAYNPNATHPPLIVLWPTQKPVAYLTKNTAFTHRIDPDTMLTDLGFIE